MDSEDGELFVKHLASFIRQHEQPLARALQVKPAHANTEPSNPLAYVLSFFKEPTSRGPQSAKLALTPHHLFYILSRLEELGINVGSMKIRLDNISENAGYSDYISARGLVEVGDAKPFWQRFNLFSQIPVGTQEQQKSARQADLKYLYSAFTKIPCLRLAPDWRARLIRGYEEFPFDTAVPLMVFKNLQALEISDIDYRQFYGWHRLADQLKSLTLKRANVEDPCEILVDIVLADTDRRRGQRRGGASSASSAPATFPSYSFKERQTALSKASAGNNDRYSEHTSEIQSARDRTPRVRRSSSNPRAQTQERQSQDPASQRQLAELATVLPVSKWRFLKHLGLADNALTMISEVGLKSLSHTLLSLDLSSNLFLEVPPSLSTLTALRALNLSNCMIDSLHSLTRHPLPAITALNLRGNRLQSLAGIEKLYTLERLDLRENRLADPFETARLTGIPDIREVWVDKNPFVNTHKDYRITIFNIFRQTPGYTEDILIDGTGPNSSETRRMVERVPVPDSVPVVKPILRTERAITPLQSDLPVQPKRRRASRRRIVDLSETIQETEMPESPHLLPTSVQDMVSEVYKKLPNLEPWTTKPDQVDIDNASLPEESVIGKESMAVTSDSGYASKQYSIAPSTTAADETVTIYTDIPNMPITTADSYVRHFVHHTVGSIDTELFDPAKMPFVLESLRYVVQGFSRKLYYEAASSAQREASIFVHKHKEDILEKLSTRLDEDLKLDQRQHEERGMPATEIGKWIERLEGETTTPSTQDFPTEEPLVFEDLAKDNLADTDAVDAQSTEAFEQHWEFVRQTAAFKWLVSRLEQHVRLSTPEPDHLQNISKCLFDGVWSKADPNFRRMSRFRLRGEVTMAFALHWNPLEFLSEQGFEAPFQNGLLGKIICLTGTWSNAQATTCAGYMHQTWPMTCGPLLELLDKFVSAPEEETRTSVTSESPRLTLSARKHKFRKRACTVYAHGNLDLVCEIGEQLGWLAAALHSSEPQEGVTSCFPRIESVDAAPCGVANVVASCSITIQTQPLPLVGSEPGFCWSQLFNSPVLVSGYPILRRKEFSPGLEMPVSIMAQLVNSRTVSRFCDRRMIKGFCSILVPTCVFSESIVWHLIYEPNGSRISYVDDRLRQIDPEASNNISMQDIENKRHIIGWCSDIVDLTGRPEANLKISSSGLRSPPSSTCIEKAYIEAGDQVVGGISMSLAKRDRPARFQARVDYIDMVDWVSSQTVVFYDVPHRLAWLVDGASATLHLVRASLAHDSARPAFQSSWVFEPTKLNEATDQKASRLASVQVLVDEENRNLPIYKKDRKTGACSIFQDRVEDILHYLQQMMDHQSEVETRDGLWLRNSFSVRKNLIGFDFHDIATRSREVWPRIQYLRETGYGWVDFARKLKAVTIFGDGFGDLIRPGLPLDTCCSLWTTPRPGQDYLGTAIATLKNIHDERKAAGFSCHEIVKDIVWVSSGELFKPCSCIGNSNVTPAHNDPVQVLLPKGSKLFPRLPKTVVSLSNLQENGAVVFGHNYYLKIRWPNDGTSAPLEGDPAAESEVQSVMTESEQLSLSASGRNESSLETPFTTSTSVSEATQSAEGSPKEESKSPEPSISNASKSGKSRWRSMTSPWRLLFKQNDAQPETES